MIIKASARSGARNLANHLASTKDNDHVAIHEVRVWSVGLFKQLFLKSMRQAMPHDVKSLSFP